MFDLNQAIAGWKRSLRKFESFEDGIIAELESHLLDEYDRQRAKGLSEEAAFTRAAEAVGRIDAVGGEYFKEGSRSRLEVPFRNKTVFMPGLLINHLKMTIRKTVRQKGYSLIKIAGLTAGLAVFLFSWIWVQDELRWDRFHRQAGSLHRIFAESRRPDGELDRFWGTGLGYGAYLADRFPEISSHLQMRQDEYGVFRGKARDFEKILFAGPGFFSFFTFPLKQGDPASVLKEANSIVISESAVRKYFPGGNPQGQTITLRGEKPEDYTVTGVFCDMPRQSHFHADFIVPLQKVSADWATGSNFMTYIRVQPGFDFNSFDRKLAAFSQTLLKPGAAPWRLRLQPVTGIHLDLPLRDDFEPGGDRTNIFLIGTLGLLVLLMASFNFINLASALYVSRFKEVGIRKTIGASRTQVIFQFLGESLLFSLFSALAALLLIRLFLPSFIELTGKKFTPAEILDGLWWMAPLAGLLTGLLAGLYPALLVSRFSTAGRRMPVTGFRPDRARTRRYLVLAQFAASIFMVLVTLAIQTQVAYLSQKNPGFAREQMVHIRLIPGNEFEMSEEMASRLETLKSEFRKHPGITAVTGSSLMGRFGSFHQGFSYEGANPSDEIALDWIPVDFEFLGTYRISLAEGRDFSPALRSDAGRAYLLSESAVRELGWKNAIGKRFTLLAGRNPVQGRVVGVIKDFHYKSLHQTIKPVVLCLDPAMCEFLAVRIGAGQTRPVLDFLRHKWAELVPEQPFQYTFLDEQWGALYDAETSLGRIFARTSALSLFIAFLGLFGLTALAARSRTKEIGIRKVLGSPVRGIVFLLNRELAVWILAANLIAWPAGYFFLDHWLQRFAYRIPLEFRFFLEAGLTALVVAALGVSVQSARAARSNPVDSLKYE